MIIKGFFNDVEGNRIDVEFDNKNIFKIFGTNKSTIIIGEEDIYFSDDPIEIETNNDSLIEPIIRKSCTINLVTRKYLGDYLFADNERSVSVTIKKNGEMIFFGYVQPNTFSQPFSEPLDTFSINCIDYLSTLQYINYKKATLDNYDELKRNAQNITFFQMLKSIFDDIPKNSRLLYDCSKSLGKDVEGDIFHDLSINDAFIFKKEYDNITKEQEVLKEILQYLNLHIIQIKNDFIIFDWESIQKGNSRYIDIITGKEYIIQNDEISLMAHHHAMDDTNLSIDDVYNQIQVKDEIQNENSIVESPFEKKDINSVFSNKVKYMTEYISEGNGKTSYNAFLDMVNGKETKYTEASKIDWYFLPTYNKNWNFNINEGTTTIDSLQEYDEDNEPINPYKFGHYLRKNRMSALLCKFGKTRPKNIKDNSPQRSIAMEDYLFISVNGRRQSINHIDAHPTDEEIAKQAPIVEYVSKGSTAFSPNSEDTTNYLVFSGKICLQPILIETERYTAILNGKRSGQDNVVQPNTDDFFKKTIPSSKNKYGKYYTRQFYKNKYVFQDNDETLDDVCLMPVNDDTENTKFEYKLSSTGEPIDKYSKLPILECELIIGDKRLVEYDMDEFGNSKFKWVKINEGVKQYFVNENGERESYDKQTFTIGINPKIDDKIISNKFWDIQNTVTIKHNLDVSGMAIPIQMQDKLAGPMIFRILGPVNAVYKDVTRRHKTWFRHTKITENAELLLQWVENIVLNNFEAKVFTDSGGRLNYEDKDIIYLSDETNEYIQKNDKTVFKFVTQLTSKECFEKGITPSISLNAVLNTTEHLPINGIYNNITGDFDKPEKLFVDQYYRFYSKPKIVLETTLHNSIDIIPTNRFISTGLTKKFIMMGYGFDIKNNIKKITFREI